MSFHPFDYLMTKIRGQGSSRSMQPVKGLRDKVAQGSSPIAGFMSHYKDIDSYKKGGTVKKTGLAYVHKGEKIIPRSKALKKKMDC